ncbi:MAG: glycosyltransferase family 39 protein [Candidatus Omnitrophica bacterium]|nr:glycosyltransferase family 39 protein [Candidatus Omnitrophota bacterium]MBU4590906.1 glycosyltransferase family 39 protein [Candidatus Omnitrophota bacterium]
MNKRSDILLFLLILALSLARFLWLGTVPGLHGDEALYGIKTHIMMYEDPFTLNGFNAYTGPLISYLRIPMFYFMGINVFTLRLPIVILSLISIYFVYRLLRQAYNRETGIIGALLLLTMPWSFIYSRFADETHTSLVFFAICGLYYWYRGLSSGRVRNLDMALAALFLGMGVFNHQIFMLVPVTYFVYFFISHKFGRRMDKPFIVFLSAFLPFLFLRMFLIFNARIIGTDGIYYRLGQAINMNLVYKFLCSVPHLMNMLDGGIFYIRVAGEILLRVIPLTSILFIVSLIALIWRRRHYPRFEKQDAMFTSIFLLNFLINAMFLRDFSLRYFITTLMFATILIAIFIGTSRIRKWLRVGLVSLVLASNCLYVGYNYMYAFRQTGGRSSVFWTGNFFENSNGFIDSKRLYDYLKDKGIVNIWVPEEFIRWALIFLDFNDKRLNLKADVEAGSPGELYYVSYKGDGPEMHNFSGRYSNSEHSNHLNHYDIFLIKK